MGGWEKGKGVFRCWLKCGPINITGTRLTQGSIQEGRELLVLKIYSVIPGGAWELQGPKGGKEENNWGRGSDLNITD